MMQNKIEGVFKEYMAFKKYIQENSKKSAEELKQEVAEKALKKETFEEEMLVYFQEFGENSILNLDFIEVTKKLMHYCEAFQDLVEIPKNISEEIGEFKVKTVFAIVDGKKEIIDRDLYNVYKKQYLDHALANRQDEEE